MRKNELIKLKEKFLKLFARAEKQPTFVFQGADSCVACGAAVPEGIMVCPICEGKMTKKHCQICGQELAENSDICSECADAILNNRIEK